ncbi:MAG: glutamate-1-semialdehyde 2,1-aminomutase [Candidatus Sumerlaeaceae bacterium]|nr:glutamate-1-semialdehyde 2,1-aminomutase [Candidatus Sumerlaeaceae bacterium]
MSRPTRRSAQLMARARAVMPGGVSSPVRSFRAVGGEPPVIANGAGSRITDMDGNEYIDYVMSYGPLLFGHCPPFITEAIKATASRGVTFGAPSEPEVLLAELIVSAIPSVEQVRFVNSGGEAAAAAIRLCRAVSGRSKIVKCAGCYHGSLDSLLVSAGSGAATLGVPDSPGVPIRVANDTAVIEFNDHAALEEIFRVHGPEIAAFILEPVAGNMGLVPPRPDYLRAARELTRRHGALLVFDEVMTGFRLAAGGAQQIHDVQPDLTLLGKIIGGGLPVGALGGPRDLMCRLAPAGPVYQAGTLSGNPLTMRAGAAAVGEILRRGHELYETLDRLGGLLEQGLTEVFVRTGVSARVQRAGSMLTVFFTESEVANFSDARRCDTQGFTRFFHAMLEQGIYLPPSQFECWFVSAAHTEADVEQTVAAAQAALTAARG